MKTQTIKILVCIAGLLIAISAFAGKPGADPINVNGVEPSSAEQGETKTVMVTGTGFEEGATVHFLVAGSKDDSQIIVGPTSFNPGDPGLGTPDSLNLEITVQPTALATDYDVEVRASKGRKGKGTTLFKVQTSQANEQCSFEFEAEFRDADGDGIQTDYPLDDPKSFVATGGEGFRLDTNNSMKLERKNDTRWVNIDFSAHAFCDDGSADGYTRGTNQGAEAAGFCSDLKGVDLRIEHQVQERLGLCSLDWEIPEENSMWQTVVINFLSDPDGLNGDTSGLLIDPNQNSPGPQSLKLNYGCQGQFLDASYFDPGLQALITRTGENTWTIEGWQACLITQLSYPLQEPLQEPPVDPIIVDMPFKLSIVVQDSP